jgi:hypothetical protein
LLIVETNDEIKVMRAITSKTIDIIMDDIINYWLQLQLQSKIQIQYTDS